MGTSRSLALFGATLAFVFGCASPVWEKRGASRDDYSKDRYACLQESQQRVSAAAVNQSGGASSNRVVTNEGLFRACMNSRGWYLAYK